MIFAVASGKGGTGKTTVAVALAKALVEQDRDTVLLDCDIEGPNAHILTHADFDDQIAVESPVPRINLNACTFCGICAEVCEFNAITCLKDQVLVFDELCHGCGACTRFCPQRAIHEEAHEIGVVDIGRSGELAVVRGKLTVGQLLAPLVVKAVKQHTSANGDTVIDASPGTSCAVVEAVHDADYVLLVTEPTPFGLHDLKWAVELTRKLKRPFGVIVNRANEQSDIIRSFCKEESISVLLEIPDDRKVAEAYSRGRSVFDVSEDYRKLFMTLADRVSETLDCKESAV